VHQGKREDIERDGWMPPGSEKKRGNI